MLNRPYLINCYFCELSTNSRTSSEVNCFMVRPIVRSMPLQSAKTVKSACLKWDDHACVGLTRLLRRLWMVIYTSWSDCAPLDLIRSIRQKKDKNSTVWLQSVSQITSDTFAALRSQLALIQPLDLVLINEDLALGLTANAIKTLKQNVSPGQQTKTQK